MASLWLSPNYLPAIFYISCLVHVANLSHIRFLSPASRLHPLVAGAAHFKAPNGRLPLPIAPFSVANLNGPSKAFRKMEPSQGPPAAAIHADTRMQSVSFGEGNDPLVQYVVVRRDLDTELNWPAGAIIAQACHAAVAALGSAMSDNQADAQRYLTDGSNMRTVVLKVSNERELLALRDKLMQHQISHKLWQEEPAKIPTALATAPIKKSTGKVFKGIKLFS